MMIRTIVRMQLLTLLAIPLLASPGLISHIVIAGANEPGQRLIVTGRVIGADGKPRGGVVIEAHHTDASGVYLAEGARGPNPKVAARLWGRLATATDGTYRIDTIRPGSYPGGGVPAHIHIHIQAGRHEQFEILQFADDRYLTPAMRAKDGQGGTFASIRPVQRDTSGVWHCTRDFRVGGGK
ncbi:MAG: protocatechuate 3,4-dioxygenase, beta subunit [Thermoanaerobaculia bacterium]|jgi:protocatechuate 3,4-dioxygenase beta subunit|nr:protocatechuate 3,4-dioxygenase, beta subunit [Thermoanaerobaculia bacterium]